MFLTSYNRELNTANLLREEEPETLAGLFARQPAEQLQPGQSLFFEGDDARHVFELAEGALRIFRIISDGRRVITGFVYEGDLVGVSLKGNYLYGAEAIVPTKIRRLTRRAFEGAVTESDELRSQVFERVCDEMAAAQDQMVLLSCKNAEERLCTFLLKHARRASATGVAQALVQLPMTRQDMADYLGLTIETVSRTITKLAAKGVLGCVGRHSIKIIKPMALAQLAGDDDEYGHGMGLQEKRHH
ncbi:CRP/FNR family transcriptional regulator, anaerobic regulatory protein [Rhizobium sp. NFR07]|uniref:helix-turn-helix domain-containing protein n=1 Tax=Rhizobium sp. NFR07 TaxID=1566262 RepID=UPI0008E9CD21|nr:helix-turn-helix domain-containing protein [Rhizobium sp. NFR07]SFB24558.1 CRP/FNR family transcriptional regulator, anaerobic regulatory protein [Rhizobium sp. NFR07]